MHVFLFFGVRLLFIDTPILAMIMLKTLINFDLCLLLSFFINSAESLVTNGMFIMCAEQC